MLSLYKTVHTLLGFDDADDEGRPPDPLHRCRNIPPVYGGGLRILAGDPAGPRNVLVSSALRRPTDRVDPGARGLHDLVYGEGLGMCTEGLGSESCDWGMEAAEMSEGAWGPSPRRREEARLQRLRPTPPVLPWLAGGKARFIMRGVREGGRLRLVEMQREGPPEILLTSREGGRLRMNFVVGSDVEKDDGDAAAEQEEKEAAITIAEEAEEEQNGDDGEEENVKEEMGEEVDEEEEGEEVRIPVPEEWRCQEWVSGNGAPMWWTHRPMMMA